MVKKVTKKFLIIMILSLTGFYGCKDNNDNDRRIINSSLKIIGNLENGFRNPPDYAKPRVFWWWLNSMATKESITRDLEELKAKGFGGALIVDAGSSNYSVAKKTKAGPLFGSPEWKELFAFALKEADRLGLELSFNIQSGWNLGGPTVTPEDAMKKIVWSQIEVKGPIQFSDTLPLPEGKYFHDIAVQAFLIKKGKSKSYLLNWRHKTLNDRFKGFDVYPLYELREQADSLINDHDLMSDSLLNISNHLDTNGVLKWSVPPGDWRILRIGYALTGAEVSTSSDGYKGLALDYLNTNALKHFFAKVVDPILENAGDEVGKSLKYLTTDSWEMGQVNWTKNFIKEFLNRRGYDPLPYLSVVTGQIVDNRETSNRFLYDFRKTVSDCIADRMYAEFGTLTHERGLLFHPESGGPHAAPIDGLKCLGRNDIPMGEYWARSNTHRYTDDQRLFVKQSASAAHIYGKRFVAGEGPTSLGPQWERSPKDLKSVFDRVFCEGLNRIFWHTFTSSPKEFGIPGNEYFAGTHLNPNTTWWNQSQGLVDYLSRLSFLLSQGLFQADVCVYYGDDVPNFVLRKHIIKDLGFGYDYDECNAEVILNRMSVKDDKIYLPDGMHYSILRLPDSKAITLDVLQKIEQLVRDGATIVGPRPVKSTGLKNYPESDKEVQIIADKLWGNCDGINITENKYGKGRVFWGKSMRDILADDGIQPDFGFESSQDSTELDYIHRKADSTDIYFVVNRLARHGIYDTKYRYLTNLPDRYEWVDCRFRVTGKIPEIWNPITGLMEKAAVYKVENGYTVVSMQLEPEGSRFVIFRNKKDETHIESFKKDNSSFFPISDMQPNIFPSARLITENDSLLLEIFQPGKYNFTNSLRKEISLNLNRTPSDYTFGGDWQINFLKGWGAPENKTISNLDSWAEFNEPGIKYFSGTAAYHKTFMLSEPDLKNKKLYLDLGNVQELAAIIINGKSTGICWMPPFIEDITNYVHSGKNELIVRVTNLWVNRLIGDQFLPEEKRFTKTNIIKFTKGDPLRISGLLGPVKIIYSKLIPLNKLD